MIYMIPNNMEFFPWSVMIKCTLCLQDPNSSMEICLANQQLALSAEHILIQHICLVRIFLLFSFFWFVFFFFKYIKVLYQEQ